MPCKQIKQLKLFRWIPAPSVPETVLKRKPNTSVGDITGTSRNLLDFSGGHKHQFNGTHCLHIPGIHLANGQGRGRDVEKAADLCVSIIKIIMSLLILNIHNKFQKKLAI